MADTSSTTPLLPEEPTKELNMDPVIELEETPLKETTLEKRPVLTEEEIRLARQCQTCHLHDWKYTCPRCLIHSCSLTCAMKHKADAPCNGIRDKTAYVPLYKYNESNMMSDYTYLEDVSRQSDNLTRSRMGTTKDLKDKAAENRARTLAKSANHVGIHFSSLPLGMSRHKLNQSNFSKNLKQIFWSIEVNFCRGDKKERYLEHSFPSIKPFAAFFENILFAELPQGKGSYGIIRHQCHDFVQAGLDQFKIALKKEKAPRGHFVDVTQALQLQFNNVLKGETIIEYPTFYVWLKTDDIPKDILVLEEKKLLIATISETVIEEELNVESTAAVEDDTESKPAIEGDTEAKMDVEEIIDPETTPPSTELSE